MQNLGGLWELPEHCSSKLQERQEKEVLIGVTHLLVSRSHAVKETPNFWASHWK